MWETKKEVNCIIKRIYILEQLTDLELAPHLATYDGDNFQMHTALRAEARQSPGWLPDTVRPIVHLRRSHFQRHRTTHLQGNLCLVNYVLFPLFCNNVAKEKKIVYCWTACVPLKWCHIYKELAFVGWAAELSMWAEPVKDLPNHLCHCKKTFCLFFTVAIVSSFVHLVPLNSGTRLSWTCGGLDLDN